MVATGIEIKMAASTKGGQPHLLSPSTPPLQTQGYVTEEVLHMEPEEGLEKVQDALHVCRSYQTTYHDRRTNMGQYFKEGLPVEWQFQPSLVFARLDSFMGQLANIQVSVVGPKNTK